MLTKAKKSAVIEGYAEAQLVVPNGHGRGERFTVLPWQRRFLVGVFDDPDVQIAALSVPRGNGKSSFMSAIVCAFLDGPGAVRGLEISIIGPTIDQGRVVFDQAAGLLDADRRRSEFRINVHHTRLLFESRRFGTSMIVRACKASSLHGFGREKLVILDEPASWPEGSREATWRVVETSMGKNPSMRILVVGTRPVREQLVDRESGHFFERQLEGDADFVMDYSAAPDAPLTMATARKVNPSMRYFPALERRIKKDLAAARRSRAAETSFRALRLNSGLPITEDEETVELIDLETWRDLAEVDRGSLPDRDGPFALGVDVGSTYSWTAAAAYWPQTGRLEVRTACPAVPDLEHRGRKDNVGDLYVRLERSGDLQVMPGRVVDVGAFLADVLDRWGVPALIAADRWREGELREALETSPADRTPLVLRGQGFKDGAVDVRGFQTAVLDGRIRSPVNAVLRLALGDSVTARDPAGNAKMERKSSRAKTDAAVAAVLSVAAGLREKKLMEPRPAFQYHGRVRRRRAG